MSDKAIHCHELGTAKSGIAHTEDKNTALLDGLQALFWVYNMDCFVMFTMLTVLTSSERFSTSILIDSSSEAMPNTMKENLGATQLSARAHVLPPAARELLLELSWARSCCLDFAPLTPWHQSCDSAHWLSVCCWLIPTVRVL
jgi:hypothetical protein